MLNSHPSYGEIYSHNPSRQNIIDNNPHDIITVLDVKTFFNLVNKRTAFCQQGTVNYARQFTLEYYEKWLQLLNNHPFTAYHINMYLLYNALVLGISVPRELKRGFNGGVGFNPQNAVINTMYNLFQDEASFLTEEKKLFDEVDAFTNNPVVKQMQAEVSNTIINAIFVM